MTTLTITIAKKGSLEGKAANVLEVSQENILTLEIDNVIYKATFYMMAIRENGESYNQTLKTEQTGGFNMWIEKDSKKTKKTVVYSYKLN